MSEDPFALQVQRLAHRHRYRHPAGIVAEVTLQRWLTLRRRYSDPFDPELFDQIDAVLRRMPASVDATAADSRRARTDTATSKLPPEPARRRSRSAVDRPVSWSA